MLTRSHRPTRLIRTRRHARCHKSGAKSPGGAPARRRTSSTASQAAGRPRDHSQDLLLCRREHPELGSEGRAWRGKRTSAVAPTRSASSDRATSARSAQGGAFGVTPEMLVEPTEQVSRNPDHSLPSASDLALPHHAFM